MFKQYKIRTEYADNKIIAHISLTRLGWFMLVNKCAKEELEYNAFGKLLVLLIAVKAFINKGMTGDGITDR